MASVAICWSCQKVKGKRVCPARGGELICSKCCGTKRRVEIQCPEDCHYLHGADPGWQSQAQKKEEARFIGRFLTLTEGQVVFMLFVHHLIFSSKKRFSNLSDSELKEVIGTAVKTLETRAKGIVYSHPASSPYVESTSAWLADTLSARSEIQTAPEASDDEMLEVLRTIEKAVQEHADESASRESYLSTAWGFFRSTLEGAPPIELPGGDDEPPEGLIVPP